jgi:hypothetical protein
MLHQAPRAIEDFAVLLHDDFVYVFGGSYRYSSEEDDIETAENATLTNKIKSNGLFRFPVSHIKQSVAKGDQISSLTISWENMIEDPKVSQPTPRSQSSSSSSFVDISS